MRLNFPLPFMDRPIFFMNHPIAFMNRPLLLAAGLLGCLLLLPAPGSGQQALDELRTLAGANAEGYAGPLAHGLSHALAGGYADRAAPLPAFSFDLGIRLLGALRNDDERTFQAVLPDSIIFQHPTFGERVYHDPYRPRDGSTETPTIVGEGSGVVLVPTGEFQTDLIAAGQDPDDHRIQFPSGLDLAAVPVATLHASLGIGMGTDVSLHYLPAFELSPDIGDARARGISARHALSHWFSSPVDLTLVGGYQEASAGSYLDSSARHYGAIAGVKAGPLSLFGGSLVRDASTLVTYRVDNPDLPEDATEISFRSEASSSPSFVLGARLQLLALNIAGHYAFGPYDVASLKLGFGLP